MTLALMLAATLAAQKPVINVMYFDNFTTDPAFDVLRKGIADMIITDLVAWDGVTVVERERLESVLFELKLQQSKALDPETVVKVGKLLGASYSLIGSMTLDKSKNLLRIDARLRDVEKGAFVVEARADAAPDAIFDLEQQLVERLVSGLDSKLTPNAVARRKARVPSLEAARLFSEALDLSDQGKLEEAQTAMRAVVSKAPTFLLARERQQQLLERFQSYEKRKRDLVTDSVLELARRIDAVLKTTGDLDTLPQKAAERVLTLRVLKGRFIIRSAKQLFTSRDGATRVARRGSEAQALVAQRAWLANLRILRDEYARVAKRFPWPRANLEPDEQRLVNDSQLGEVSLTDPFEDELQFVLEGRASDGVVCFLLPAVGFVDPAERARVIEELDTRVATATLRARSNATQVDDAFRVVRRRADLALDLGDGDLAVSIMQKLLDVFPTAREAFDFEERIKRILEGRAGDSRAARWAEGLKTCNHMDLIVGFSASDGRWLREGGLKAIDEHGTELLKACPKLNDTTLFNNFAMLFERNDDCAASGVWWKKYLGTGGSVRDLSGWTRGTACQWKDLLAPLTWVHARLDQNWSFELSERHTSKVTADGLTIAASGWLGTPSGMKRQALTLTLRRSGASWSCVGATYLRYTGVTTNGSCTATVTSAATEPGEFDEGTWSASFIEQDEDYRRKVELTEGVFKVRRE